MRVAVRVDGTAQDAVTGSGAAFRGTTWVTLELPVGWAPDGTHLRLVFAPEHGEEISLPTGRGSYRVQYVAG